MQYKKDNYGNDFKCFKCDEPAEFDTGPNPKTGIPDATGLLCAKHWHYKFRADHPNMKFSSIECVIGKHKDCNKEIEDPCNCECHNK